MERTRRESRKTKMRFASCFPSSSPRFLFRNCRFVEHVFIAQRNGKNGCLVRSADESTWLLGCWAAGCSRLVLPCFSGSYDAAVASHQSGSESSSAGSSVGSVELLERLVEAKKE